MKKILIILVVIMIAVIGVLLYFTYPHLKEAYSKQIENLTETVANTSTTNITAWNIDVNKGETEIERVFILRYNKFMEHILLLKERSDQAMTDKEKLELEIILYDFTNYLERYEKDIRMSLFWEVNEHLKELGLMPKSSSYGD